MIFVGTVMETIDGTDLGTLDFCTPLFRFSSVPTHPETFSADGDTVVVDCEVIFVNDAHFFPMSAHFMKYSH